MRRGSWAGQQSTGILSIVCNSPSSFVFSWCADCRRSVWRQVLKIDCRTCDVFFRFSEDCGHIRVAVPIGNPSFFWNPNPNLLVVEEFVASASPTQFRQVRVERESMGSLELQESDPWFIYFRDVLIDPRIWFVGQEDSISYWEYGDHRDFWQGVCGYLNDGCVLRWRKLLVFCPRGCCCVLDLLCKVWNWWIW
jgi:hypothetical protein